MIFAPVGIFFLGLGSIVFVWQLAEWLIFGAERPIENVNLSRFSAFRFANFMLRSPRPSCGADQEVKNIAELHQVSGICGLDI